MTSRRTLVALTIGALAMAVGACSDESSSTGSTTTSTSIAESTTSTTVASSTTSSTSSTSTTSTSTTSTTTIPAVQGLEMSAEGLGDALFGADADSVIEYVTGILGASTSDSG